MLLRESATYKCHKKKKSEQVPSRIFFIPDRSLASIVQRKQMSKWCAGLTSQMLE